MIRFDIVIFNYNRFYCFINNFDKILNFDFERDRITCVSNSACKRERVEVEDFCHRKGIRNFRYLAHRNFGMAERARLDFFSGKTGGDENFESQFIFQMQEHYLDIDDPCSRWGSDLDYRIKGDVCPDNIVFDLNEIETLFERDQLSTLFADRGKPMRYAIGNRRFIAPNGGNFILRTSLLKPLKKRLLRLRKTCDGTYTWAVFMEYYWGELFFEEGNNSYDYDSRVLLKDYKGNDKLFKIGLEDYCGFRNGYLTSRFYPGVRRRITIKDVFSEKGKRAAKRVVLGVIGIIRYRFFNR